MHHQEGVFKIHIKNSEDWKDVEGYEGIYQISNWGRVKSLSRERYNGHGYYVVGDKIRKLMLSEKGYYLVMLTKNNTSKNYRVHRLVAKHFIPNINNYPIINHIDEIKTNNHVNNLEWCTQNQNLNHGNARLNQSKGQNIPVLQCDLYGNVIRRYDSMIDTRQDGFSNSGVGRCCSGERKSHKGFIWRYAND